MANKSVMRERARGRKQKRVIKRDFANKSASFAFYAFSIKCLRQDWSGIPKTWGVSFPWKKNQISGKKTGWNLYILNIGLTCGKVLEKLWREFFTPEAADRTEIIKSFVGVV